MVKTMVRLVLLLLVLLVAIPAWGQVQPIPFTPSQWFDNNGKPLIGGCVFTYISNTTTPQATYTDYTGGTPNANPVILDSAGRADIWLSAAAYTFKFVSHGGTNCSTGLTIRTENGINPSANSILGSNNVWTGTNTFNAAVIFNSSITFNAGITSTGPNNFSGGGSLSGSYSGSPTFSGQPNFSGGFNATTGTFSGQIISTVATGTPPLVVASTTNVPNLNASSVNGCTFPIPCPLGSTTPNSVAATTVTATTSIQLASGPVFTSTQGTDTKIMSAGTVAGTGAALCTDANGGATTTGCTSGFTKAQAFSYCPAGCTITGTPCTPGSGSSYDACSNTITWPSGFADALYGVSCSGYQPAANGGNAATNQAPMLVMGSKNATTVTVITQQERGAVSSFTEIDCTGIHP